MSKAVNASWKIKNALLWIRIRLDPDLFDRSDRDPEQLAPDPDTAQRP